MNPETESCEYESTLPTGCFVLIGIGIICFTITTVAAMITGG